MVFIPFERPRDHTHFLFNYKNTTHTVTECTPAELILKQQPTSHCLVLMARFVTCNYGEATAQEALQIVF